MTYVNWKGKLRGRATAWRLWESPDEKKQTLFVEIDLVAQQGMRPEGDEGWLDLPSETLYQQRARILIVGVDGTLQTENVEALQKALGWDGSATTIEKTPEIDLRCQWFSSLESPKKGSKKPAKYYDAGFLKPYDQEGPAERISTPGAGSRFDDTYGSQLRALVASSGTTPKPTPDTKPAAGKTPENPDADSPPAEHAKLTDPPENGVDYSDKDEKDSKTSSAFPGGDPPF